MADSRHEARRDFLVRKHFTPLEARELAAIPKATPALQKVIHEREARWIRFSRAATRRVRQGIWRPDEVSGKWLTNLGRMYTRSRWRVREGPRGKQHAMPKGGPNPWAMYRNAIKVSPGKKHVSPWEIRQIWEGKTPLERGIIFIQRVERMGGASLGQVQQWIVQKNAAIRKAKGKRKEQLVIERNRLERLLK